MALTDINFQQGEGQDFILERPAGTLYAPVDILVEADGTQYMVMEVAGTSGGTTTNNIFIMSE